MQRYMRGITLPELLIAMVILATLAAIAYPDYRQFVARSKRSEARAALLQIATYQERHYLQNNTYTADLTKLGFASSSNHVTESGSYMINVTAADANNFTASAVYQHSDAEADKCRTFGIDGRSMKTSTPESNCWVRTR